MDLTYQAFWSRWHQWLTQWPSVLGLCSSHSYPFLSLCLLLLPSLPLPPLPPSVPVFFTITKWLPKLHATWCPAIRPKEGSRKAKKEVQLSCKYSDSLDWLHRELILPKRWLIWTGLYSPTLITYYIYTSSAKDIITLGKATLCSRGNPPIWWGQQLNK